MQLVLGGRAGGGCACSVRTAGEAGNDHDARMAKRRRRVYVRVGSGMLPEMQQPSKQRRERNMQLYIAVYDLDAISTRRENKRLDDQHDECSDNGERLCRNLILLFHIIKRILR